MMVGCDCSVMIGFEVFCTTATFQVPSQQQRPQSGNLRILHGSRDFPPGRELIFFHRPEQRFHLPTQFHMDIVDDMLRYGFLLPTWVPLLTRHVCNSVTKSGREHTTLEAMHHFHPYQGEVLLLLAAVVMVLMFYLSQYLQVPTPITTSTRTIIGNCFIKDFQESQNLPFNKSAHSLLLH